MCIKIKSLETEITDFVEREINSMVAKPLRFKHNSIHYNLILTKINAPRYITSFTLSECNILPFTVVLWFGTAPPNGWETTLGTIQPVSNYQ